MIGVAISWVCECSSAMQVEHALAVRHQHLAQVLDRQIGHVLVVARRLDHDFVRADAVHLVVQPLAAPIELAFDLQRRELVRHHAHVPAGRVRRAALEPVHVHLGRRLVFVSRAERTEAVGFGRRRGLEIRGPAAALGGDDHPASDDRILAKLGHVGP
jgi:hypothetical protein